MAHNSPVRNPVTLWTTNSQILRFELAKLDALLASAINGDDGGTYAPTSPIAIGGRGLTLTGPLVVARGGSLTANSPGGYRLADNDWPQLGPTHIGRSRTVVYPCLGSQTFPARLAWFPRWADAGMQSMAPTIDMSDGLGPRPARLWVPIRAHDGATISSVTVSFRVGWPHAQLPGTMPSARVLAVDGNGVISWLTSQSVGGDPSGYIFATKPSTPGRYSGNQSITIPCDQNTIVSLATYSYYVEIVEEQGLTGYPWALVVKQPVRYSVFSSVSGQLSGLNPYEGLTPVDGDRVLVNAPPSTNPLAVPINGIWIAHPGIWTRATDMQLASDFSRGMLVQVLQGNTMAGSVWQASSTTTSWTPGTMPQDVTQWVGSHGGYAVGTNVIPTTSHTTGYWYQATSVAGTATSSSSEPAWPVVVGQSVIDNPGPNQIVWTCMGSAAGPLQFVARGQDDVETPVNVGSERLPHGNIWQAVSVQFTGITQASFD